MTIASTAWWAQGITRIWEDFIGARSTGVVEGEFRPDFTAIYTDIVSNYMYGVFVGCEQEWYWATASPPCSTSGSRATSTSSRSGPGTSRPSGIIANKRATTTYYLVGEVEGHGGPDVVSRRGHSGEGRLRRDGVFEHHFVAQPVAFDYSGA